MQHALTATTENVSRGKDNIWSVNLGASHHMRGCNEWFEKIQKLDTLGYVQTGDDATHQIEHIGEVP